MHAGQTLTDQHDPAGHAGWMVRLANGNWENRFLLKPPNQNFDATVTQ
jgi:hypothetical protein